MWKSFGPIVGCCLAAMPLLGCVGGYTALPPQVGPPPAAGAAAVSEPGVDTTPTEAPATVLVFLPGAVEFGDVAARDPRLWAAQGFDVVMPPPGDLVRLAADQQPRSSDSLLPPARLRMRRSGSVPARRSMPHLWRRNSGAVSPAS